MTEPSATTSALNIDIAQLTTKEKASLTVGKNASETNAIERLGIRSARLVDGPHGVRAQNDASNGSMFNAAAATCFPTAATLGSTWNVRLVEEIGGALGREAVAAKVDILLGPGVNLKRTPLGGRNFEYLSEDPLLSGALGAAWIHGLQQQGVGASIKHFAANNAEQRRYGVSTYVDERALRELYLASFERPIKQENPATIMAAYSKLNGTHCAENSWLLKTLLRDEWGYRGVVVSDWGAGFDGVAALAGGTDLTMPGPLDPEVLVRAVYAGQVSAEDLNRAAERVLTLRKRVPGVAAPVIFDEHHALARKAASEGAVLLKNTASLLPLGREQSIAVVGAFAKEPRYQGGGSSNVVPTQVDNLLDSLRKAVGSESVTYAAGYDRHSSVMDAVKLNEAVDLAGHADVAVVVVGLPEAFESEGVDRSHMRLPEAHNALVAAVLRANRNTVVVLIGGSPVEMPWVADAATILEAYLGGQAGGSGLTDVLLGDAEPGGRLAETFVRTYSDHPVASLPNGPAQIEYWESVFLGYRYFDSAAAEVAFPFGHGLSYTTFNWSELSVTPKIVVDSPDLMVTVTLRITNTGPRAGSEVVQLYVHDYESSVPRPEQELRAFEKVHLQPGESADVVLPLDRRAFAFWDRAEHDWVVETGQFEVRVGSSSRDIRRRARVELHGPAPEPLRQGSSVYSSISRGAQFTREAFREVYGHKIPENITPRAGRFVLDTALRDMQSAFIGRILFRFMRKAVAKELGIAPNNPLMAIADEVVGQVNFRMFPTLTGGGVNPNRAKFMLRMVNVFSYVCDLRNRSKQSLRGASRDRS